MPAHGSEVGVPTDLGVEMGMEIDEPRGDREVRSVDFACAASVDLAHGRDPPPVHRHVAGSGLSPGSIYELAAANDEIMSHRVLLERVGCNPHGAASWRVRQSDSLVGELGGV